MCNELGFQGRPQSHSPFGWSLLAPRTAHKPLFPLSVRDIIGLTLAALGLALSASGGLGGGGILVPLYLIVLREFGWGVHFAGTQGGL